MKNTSHISWFSIIEVLVGIFIFTLGLISIYLIMVSSLKLNDYNKNQIIASNLAREQIELVRNVRDSNYKTLHSWNWIPNWWATPDFTKTLETWKYYKIENEWNPSADYPVKINNLAYTGEGEDKLLTDMEAFRLCLDANNRYIFCPSTEETSFYKYVKIEDIWIADADGIANAVKVISKVIWYKRGYHEVEINTILSDWKRL